VVARAGSVDWIEFVADSVGYWYLHVNRVVSEGRYRFSVDISWPYGCPILYFYDGQQYRSEGTLNIHNPNGNDITTDHTLRATPQSIFGTYRFKLVEHPLTNSSIDQVKLYAIFEGGAKIELPLVWACHSEYGNVLPQLLFSDNWKTENLGARFNNGVSQSIQLWFIGLPPSAGVRSFVFQIEGNNPNSKQ
jgi:hypothetical protein